MIKGLAVTEDKQTQIKDYIEAINKSQGYKYILGYKIKVEHGDDMLYFKHNDHRYRYYANVINAIQNCLNRIWQSKIKQI